MYLWKIDTFLNSLYDIHIPAAYMSVYYDIHMYTYIYGVTNK